MGDLDTLIEFGFDKEIAQNALDRTKNAGLQAALDYLEKHPDGGGDDDNDNDEADEDVGMAVDVPEEQAKSLKCGDCGKVFRGSSDASWHSEKSGHQNFEESTEEIKPLTEEEKKEKLAFLRTKLAEKRAKQSVQDAEEAKRNETIRRKGGKDMANIREETQKKIAENEAAKAKRDKIEEAKAKARVKEQIEADKQARREKAEREKAARSGAIVDTPVAPKPPQVPKPSAKKDHNETRLQIRLPGGGNPLVTTFPSSKTLADLATWVSEQTGLASSSIKFSTTFPKKTFAPDDMSKTMTDLDLVPSSVLIVQS